jgi:hypothetical protein
VTYLDVRPDAIPAELRELPSVLWRPEPRPDGKPAKVPYRVDVPTRRASSTNRRTWAPFADAVGAYLDLRGQDDPIRGPVAGIGDVLVQSQNVTCFDLDRVIDERGELDTRAATIVERCNSWTEISPSGRGLHVFVRGVIPTVIKGDQIEIYSTARFICLTGHRWPGTPDDVQDAQDYLTWLWKKAQAIDRPRCAYTGPVVPPPDDLAGHLLAKLATWGIRANHIRRWSDGYLVELDECPWAAEHTTGRGGAAVMIHASGALDFTCLHAHCAGRTWRDFRGRMETSR